MHIIGILQAHYKHGISTLYAYYIHILGILSLKMAEASGTQKVSLFNSSYVLKSMVSGHPPESLKMAEAAGARKVSLFNLSCVLKSMVSGHPPEPLKIAEVSGGLYKWHFPL